MKKLLLSMSVIVMVVLLSGCSKKLDLDPPSDQVVLNKNVSLGDICYEDAPEYEELVITDQDTIKNLFDSLNEWEYKEENFTQLDICGFRYTIEWEDHDLEIVGSTYFYMDGQLYKFTNVDFHFLDEIKFTVKEE